MKQAEGRLWENDMSKRPRKFDISAGFRFLEWGWPKVPNAITLCFGSSRACLRQDLRFTIFHASQSPACRSKKLFHGISHHSYQEWMLKKEPLVVSLFSPTFTISRRSHPSSLRRDIFGPGGFPHRTPAYAIAYDSQDDACSEILGQNGPRLTSTNQE